MTFHTDLDRLKQAIERGDIRVSECAEFIRNHAPAILELVRAAESLRDGLPEQDPYASELVAALNSALAKLNGGKG